MNQREQIEYLRGGIAFCDDAPLTAWCSPDWKRGYLHMFDLWRMVGGEMRPAITYTPISTKNVEKGAKRMRRPTERAGTVGKRVRGLIRALLTERGPTKFSDIVSHLRANGITFRYPSISRIVNMVAEKTGDYGMWRIAVSPDKHGSE